MSEPVRPSPPTQRIRGDASKRLRRSAIRAVRNNSDAISEALLKQTLKGNTACGKLLISLVQATEPAKSPKPREPEPPPQPAPKPDPPKPKRSLATEWASEPEFIPTAESDRNVIETRRKIIEEGEAKRASALGGRPNAPGTGTG
jgi:hypothetical protein